MTDTVTTADAPVPTDEIQRGWRDLLVRVEKLEAENAGLEEENKSLRALLERVIEHRQKSHGELVMLLTSLVSKLPLNDVGVIVSKLVEHNTAVTQALAALSKGTAEVVLPQPEVLKTLEQTRRELLAAVQPLTEELLRLEAPIEPELLHALVERPESFFSPRMVRANRCFVKGQVARERVLKEFGPDALVFFQDVTTDPKLNPHPKAEEIVLVFRGDFETLLAQQTNFPGDKRQELLKLYQRVQTSKSTSEAGRAQRLAFQKLSFLIDLLHYYEHQNTEAPDVIFAQRLPVLVEQLVLSSPTEELDEKLIVQAEHLLNFVINPDHRHMVVNNMGKGGGAGRTLRYVLRLRSDKVPDSDELVPEFIKHLVAPQKAPPVEKLTFLLRLLHPAMQRQVVRSLMSCDRLRKSEAEALGRSVGQALGLKSLEEELKAREPAVPPEMERRLAWGKIKDLISHRTDPVAVAATIRERLNAKYDADEIRQSWLTLTEADPMSLIKIFCQIPYRADGKTDGIARPVIETYVTRLTHEKYAGTYKKVLTSLKSMFRAKPDSPTLLNFLALVRWVSPEAADRVSADIGIPVTVH